MEQLDEAEDEEKISRWQISPSVLVVLQQVYAMDPFPSTEIRKQLAMKLKAHPRQIQTWFQNRRARERRLGGTVQRPPATPLAPGHSFGQPLARTTSMGSATGVAGQHQPPSAHEAFMHDPYIDAAVRQLQQQQQLAQGAGRQMQMPMFPPVLEGCSAASLSQMQKVVAESVKTAGSGTSSAGGGSCGAAASSDGSCGSEVVGSSGASARGIAALQGVSSTAYHSFESSLFTAQLRRAAGIAALPGGFSVKQAACFPSVWQQAAGIGALAPLQGELQGEVNVVSPPLLRSAQSPADGALLPSVPSAPPAPAVTVAAAMEQREAPPAQKAQPGDSEATALMAPPSSEEAEVAGETERAAPEQHPPSGETPAPPDTVEGGQPQLQPEEEPPPQGQQHNVGHGEPEAASAPSAMVLACQSSEAASREAAAQEHEQEAQAQAQQEQHQQEAQAQQQAQAQQAQHQQQHQQLGQLMQQQAQLLQQQQQAQQQAQQQQAQQQQKQQQQQQAQQQQAQQQQAQQQQQVHLAEQHLAHLTQQQAAQQSRQIQLMQQLHHAQHELSLLMENHPQGSVGGSQRGGGAAAAALQQQQPAAGAAPPQLQLPTSRVLPGSLVRMLSSAHPPHVIMSGTQSWFDLFELKADDLNRDGSKHLSLVSLFGPETDLDEGARVMAAAASQSPTRSRCIVAYTQRRQVPLTLSLDLQPLFNSNNNAPFLIWTFDAVDETAVGARVGLSAHTPGMAAAHALAATNSLPDLAKAARGGSKRSRTPSPPGCEASRGLQVERAPLTADVMMQGRIELDGSSVFPAIGGGGAGGGMGGVPADVLAAARAAALGSPRWAARCAFPCGGGGGGCGGGGGSGCSGGATSGGGSCGLVDAAPRLMGGSLPGSLPGSCALRDYRSCSASTMASVNLSRSNSDVHHSLDGHDLPMSVFAGLFPSSGRRAIVEGAASSRSHAGGGVGGAGSCDAGGGGGGGACSCGGGDGGDGDEGGAGSFCTLADLEVGPKPHASSPGDAGDACSGSGSNPSDAPEFLSNVLIDAFLDDFNSIHNDL